MFHHEDSLPAPLSLSRLSADGIKCCQLAEGRKTLRPCSPLRRSRPCAVIHSAPRLLFAEWQQQARSSVNGKLFFFYLLFADPVSVCEDFSTESMTFRIFVGKKIIMKKKQKTGWATQPHTRAVCTFFFSFLSKASF